jgi:dTDP-4-dehydrorhamnose 3,5-epimerase
VTSSFFKETLISGVLIYEPRVFHDDRGYFFESYSTRHWQEAGLDVHFVQDNQARSTRGVLRGLHYQVGADAQAKLVRVVEGSVLDVAVDLRPGSPTFGQHIAVELSAENKRQLFVPRGFAHGYLVLSETAEFSYKCDNFYAKHAEGGLRFDCPHVNIDWGMPTSELLVSEKDLVLPFLGEHRVG